MALQPLPQSNEEEEDKARLYFQIFDIDGNGTIDANELQTMLECVLHDYAEGVTTDRVVSRSALDQLLAQAGVGRRREGDEKVLISYDQFKLLYDSVLATTNRATTLAPSSVKSSQCEPCPADTTPDSPLDDSGGVKLRASPEASVAVETRPSTTGAVDTVTVGVVDDMSRREQGETCDHSGSAAVAPQKKARGAPKKGTVEVVSRPQPQRDTSPCDRTGIDSHVKDGEVSGVRRSKRLRAL